MSGLREGKETNAGAVERECSVAIEIGTEGEGDVFQGEHASRCDVALWSTYVLVNNYLKVGFEFDAIKRV